MKFKFSTFELNNIPYICMSREEILAMLNSLDKNESENDRLIQFLEALEEELIKS